MWETVKREQQRADEQAPVPADTAGEAAHTRSDGQAKHKDISAPAPGVKRPSLPDPRNFPAWFKAWFLRNFIPQKARVKEIFLDGLWRQNPVLVLCLGLCTFLMTSTGLKTALGMGLATTFVLTGAELLISMLRKVVPPRHRNSTRTLCVATFTAAAELLMGVFFPDLAAELGIYLPLIAVSSILPARTGDFAPEHLPIYAGLDGIAMGLGFTGAICALGAIRELLGAGTLWGVPILKGMVPQLRLLTQPAGGLILFGCLLALLQWWKTRKQKTDGEEEAG